MNEKVFVAFYIYLSTSRVLSPVPKKAAGKRDLPMFSVGIFPSDESMSAQQIMSQLAYL